MKAYTLAELAVSLLIVFMLLISSVFVFKSFSPQSVFNSDRESISSKLNQASILAKSITGTKRIVLAVSGRKLAIYKENSDGNREIVDQNPVLIKSEIINIQDGGVIVFNVPSGVIENPNVILLQSKDRIYKLEINEQGVLKVE